LRYTTVEAIALTASKPTKTISQAFKIL
jgi:hypothetical protein